MQQIIADTYAIQLCEDYRDAHKYVTTYEAKKKSCRAALIENYFANYEILVSDHGIIMATAKLQEREDFDTKRFKEDHPELHAKYIRKSTIQKLDVK